MRGMLAVVVFIALTVLSWGVYGPVLHVGQHAMRVTLPDGTQKDSLWLPFICVGLAYFVIAVVVPLVRLWSIGEAGRWSVTGSVQSLAAGALGAVGALGIILAFNSGGSPIYVMPLVFGCAPVVNTFVTMVFARAFREIRPIFYVGLVLVIAGAVMVMVFKPSPQAPAGGGAPVAAAASRPVDPLMVTVSIALTALCWGAYGPVLHKGQAAMAGSRMRPFICVGVAYFLVAVVVPLAWIQTQTEPVGVWTLRGSVWSLAGGAAGAIGALGIIMAFNYGGKPVYVMPLVFGGAPVVNTFTTVLTALAAGKPLTTTPVFFIALLTVTVGAVVVLVFAPRPGKHAVPPHESTPRPANVAAS